MIGFPLLQRGGGEGNVGVAIGEVIGKHGAALSVGHHHQVLRFLCELQHHEQLGGIALDGVIHVARAHNHAAVEIAAHVRVNAAVHAGGMGQVDGRAPVEDDRPIGVNAVSLAALQVFHRGEQVPVVEGQHAHTVLGHIHRVIAGGNMKHASVDGQVAVFHLNTLVVRIHGQASASRKAQGHHGVNGAVILHAAFVPCRMGAGDMVVRPISQFNGHAIGTGRRRFQG